MLHLTVCTTVLFTSLLLHAATMVASQIQDCEPTLCGDVNITYPFWLVGRQPNICGHPAFMLTCDGGTPYIQRSYLDVLHVDYRNSSFVALNANVADTVASCNAPDGNVSSNLALTPFSISQANRELFFLHNCRDAPPPGAFPMNCSSNGTFAYLGGNYTSSGPVLRGGCQVTSVPVYLPSEQEASAREYVKLVKKGFLLDWTVTVSDCSTCMASGGRCAFNDPNAAFVCACPDGSQRTASCDGKSTKSRKRLILIVSLPVTAALLFACLIFLKIRGYKRFWFFSFSKKKYSNPENIEKILEKYGSMSPKRFRYSEVKKITRSFSEKLGEGGYGTVFKGSLQTGQLVAVKFLSKYKGNGEEFVNEVISIGRTSHVNIVGLLGFCLEGSKRALIYEYMQNSSLERYIYSNDPKTALGWEKLQEIAVGIARGLEYLHTGCNTRIVHFDIKPHNILLDREFHPKIADFGLAKLCLPKESTISMADARGTIGFIAPEVLYKSFGVVSTKSDVYSYGMMVLEMVGGRKNLIADVVESREVYFPHWIYDRLSTEGRLHGFDITNETEEIARKLAIIGLWCIQIMPVNRPTIGKVLDMFAKSVNELEMPPKHMEFPPPPLKVEDSSSLLSTQKQGLSEMRTLQDEMGLINSEILPRFPTF